VWRNTASWFARAAGFVLCSDQRKRRPTSRRMRLSGSVCARLSIHLRQEDRESHLPRSYLSPITRLIQDNAERPNGISVQNRLRRYELSDRGSAIRLVPLVLMSLRSQSPIRTFVCVRARRSVSPFAITSTCLLKTLASITERNW